MMKLRRNRRGRRVKAEMNVVPYIDVMLVLLVIFMIAAPLINQTVEVQLPVAPGEAFEMPEGLPDGQQPLVLTIDENGNYFINDGSDEGRTETEVVLRAATLRQQYPTLPVIVRGDRRVAYDALLGLVLELRKNGVDAVGMATSPDAGAQ